MMLFYMVESILIDYSAVLVMFYDYFVVLDVINAFHLLQKKKVEINFVHTRYCYELWRAKHSNYSIV